MGDESDTSIVFFLNLVRVMATSACTYHATSLPVGMFTGGLTYAVVDTAAAVEADVAIVTLCHGAWEGSL